jgi:hypothetical protein
MIMAETAACGNLDQLKEMVDNLMTFVRQAAVEGAAVHKVESEIWQRMLAMGRQAMEAFLQMQGDGDVGATIETPDGKELKRLPEQHQRTYHSIFRPFSVSRYVYGTREGQRIDFVPLDARLELPENEYSYVLQDWAGTLCVEHAFARTARTLETILGLSLPVDSLERMSRRMAESVEGFRSSLKKPSAKDEGEILVATADGKGIPMRRPADQRPVGARRKKGEKANKKQMATLGCVYTVDPKHRTAEDVIEALFREHITRPGGESPEPVARHKRVWSSLTYDEGEIHVNAETEVFSWMASEVEARHCDGQPMVCLMDGQRSLWNSCAEHFPRSNVVEILDLLHVMEYVWNAAYLFHAEGSEVASAFVRDRVLRILHGEVGYVIGGLRQMATKRGLPADKQRKLSQICNYLSRNRHRMCYNEYLSAGYPIASGVIEGACRHVVKDRMERSGMRWTIDGAQAMLDLRSTSINDQWSAFVAHRIHAETQRLYPEPQLLERLAFQLTI